MTCYKTADKIKGLGRSVLVELTKIIGNIFPNLFPRGSYSDLYSIADTIQEGKGQQATIHHDDYPSSEKFNLEEARRATAIEHSLTWWEALKTYQKATLGLSVSIPIAFFLPYNDTNVENLKVISTAVIMEGYDNHLLGNFIGYPAFRSKYGTYIDETKGYQISSAWPAGLTDIGSIGNIIGALLNGYFTPKVGPAGLGW